jgi:hypothetical protein
MVTFLTVGPFAVDTLRRKTFSMRQVPIFAKPQRISRPTAHVTGQRLDDVQQWVPCGGTAHGSGPLANFYRQIQFWLGNERQVEQL